MSALSPNICSRCGLRKQSFATRAEAKAQARRSRVGPRLRVYACGPYSWHLTSADADFVAELRERASQGPPS